jgi:RNA polymerase sigma factor (sigma-70 family)
MVWAVCRRVLRNEADAEDAFQATFLVLVRKAACIVPRAMVGNWLYGVAHNTALKAKAMNRKRREKERQAGTMPRPDGADEGLQKLRARLDVELSRLPDKYRAPVVLCDLEGKTRKEAARQLGWAEGTVAGRLARARAMLAGRLSGHGPVLSGGALAAALAQDAAGASLPAPLVISTIRATALFATHQALTTGALPAKVVALTEGVLKTMFLTKLKTVTTVLLAVALGSTLATAVGLRAMAAGRDGQPAPGNPQATVPAGESPGDEADDKNAKPQGGPPSSDVWKEQAAFDLGGKGASAFSLAVSPDGHFLAVGQEGKVRLWEITTSRELATLEQEGTIWSVAFSPDGTLLATGSKLGTAKIWDVGNLRERAALDGHTNNVNSVAFSPDGKTLATGSFDKTVRLWDVATGKELRQLPGPQDAVTSVAIAPDGKTLAAAESMARTIRCWDLTTGKELRTLTGHTDLVWCLAFSPDGKTLASGSRDCTVRLWDTATGNERGVLKWHVSQVNAVAFSPDGKTLVSAGGTNDNTVEIWDVAAQKELATLKDHTETVWSVAFARQAKVFATGGNDGVVRVWRVEKRPAEKK